MKHKPMLINKVLRRYPGRGREVIGLVGTHHGAGVTHTGLMLAFYMGEVLGRKTAFLECNTHHDMMLIQNSYEWVDEKEISFSYHQITCYREVMSARIPEILGEDYECIIFDFGADINNCMDEFLRCTRKMIVSGRSEWDLQKLNRFVHASESIRGSDTWLYLIPQGKDKTILKTSNELQRRISSVPFSEEPTIPSPATNRFFGKIFT